MDDRTCSYTPTVRDKMGRKLADVRHYAYMKWHSFYWKVLYLTRLARSYSELMCKLNRYRKFPDGRCHYCGKNH